MPPALLSQLSIADLGTVSSTLQSWVEDAAQAGSIDPAVDPPTVTLSDHVGLRLLVQPTADLTDEATTSEMERAVHIALCGEPGVARGCAIARGVLEAVGAGGRRLQTWAYAPFSASRELPATAAAAINPFVASTISSTLAAGRQPALAAALSLSSTSIASLTADVRVITTTLDASVDADAIALALGNMNELTARLRSASASIAEAVGVRRAFYGTIVSVQRSIPLPPSPPLIDSPSPARPPPSFTHPPTSSPSPLMPLPRPRPPPSPPPCAVCQCHLPADVIIAQNTSSALSSDLGGSASPAVLLLAGLGSFVIVFLTCCTCFYCCLWRPDFLRRTKVALGAKPSFPLTGKLSVRRSSSVRRSPMMGSRERINREEPQPRDPPVGTRQTDLSPQRWSDAAAPAVPRLPFVLPKAQLVFLERLDTLIGRVAGDRGSALTLRIVRSAAFTWVTVLLTAVPLLFHTMLVVTSTLYNEETSTDEESRVVSLVIKGSDSNASNASNMTEASEASSTSELTKSFFDLWWELETTYSIFVSLVWCTLVALIVMTMNAPAAKRAFRSFNGLFSLYNLLRWIYAFVACSQFSPGISATLLLFSTGGTVLWCAADALQTRRALRLYLGCWLCLNYMSLMALSVMRFRFSEGDLMYGVGLTLGVTMSAVDVHVQAALTLMIFIAKDCAFELRHPGYCSVVRVSVRKQWIVNGKIDEDDEYEDDPAAAEMLQEKLSQMREEQSRATPTSGSSKKFAERRSSTPKKGHTWSEGIELQSPSRAVASRGAEPPHCDGSLSLGDVEQRLGAFSLGDVEHSLGNSAQDSCRRATLSPRRSLWAGAPSPTIVRLGRAHNTTPPPANVGLAATSGTVLSRQRYRCQPTMRTAADAPDPMDALPDGDDDVRECAVPLATAKYRRANLTATPLATPAPREQESPPFLSRTSYVSSAPTLPPKPTTPTKPMEALSPRSATSVAPPGADASADNDHAALEDVVLDAEWTTRLASGPCTSRKELIVYKDAAVARTRSCSDTWLVSVTATASGGASASSANGGASLSGQPPSSSSAASSELEEMRKKLGQFMLGGDTSGGQAGTHAALTLSNAITNLSVGCWSAVTELAPPPDANLIKWRQQVKWYTPPLLFHMLHLLGGTGPTPHLSSLLRDLRIRVRYTAPLEQIIIKEEGFKMCAAPRTRWLAQNERAAWPADAALLACASGCYPDARQLRGCACPVSVAGFLMGPTWR